jgi:type II secretory pathway pseudopilin PulG
MKKSTYGITIVELLIVIVVIGILGSITVVAYGGVQNKAINTARYQEIMAWHRLLQTYIAQEGKLPPVAQGDYCLGTGFPDGDGVAGGECRDYNAYWTTTYHETAAASLMNELKKISSLPGGPRKPVNGTVGPYVTTYSSSYTMYTVFNGNQPSECPTGMLYSWSDGNGRLICQIDFTLP